MATTTLKRLLKKKKLTGEEVGRIILLDLINSFTGQPELSPEEIQTYSDALTTNADIAVYNDYLAIYRFIIHMVAMNESTEHAFNSYKIELLRHVQTISNAESFYLHLAFSPRILTKRDYDQARKETLESIRTDTHCFLDLFTYEVKKAINNYLNENEDEYTELLSTYREQKAPQRIKDEIKKIYEHPNGERPLEEEFTMFLVLEEYLDIYNDYETDKEGGVLQLKKDYPELCKAIIDKYSKLEGLEHLKDLTDEGYLKEDLINFETAYKLDICNVKDHYDNPVIVFKGRHLSNGVAVITDDKADVSGYIKDGTFYYQLGHSALRNLAEGVLSNEKLIGTIEGTKRLLQKYAKELVAFSYFIDKMAEVTSIKEMEIFKRKDDTAFLSAIDVVAKNIYVIRHGLLENEGNPTELGESIRELCCVGFTLDDLQVTEAEKEKVDEILAQADNKKEDALREALKFLLGS